MFNKLHFMISLLFILIIIIYWSLDDILIIILLYIHIQIIKHILKLLKVKKFFFFWISYYFALLNEHSIEKSGT